MKRCFTGEIFGIQEDLRQLLALLEHEVENLQVTLRACIVEQRVDLDRSFLVVKLALMCILTARIRVSNRPIKVLCIIIAVSRKA